jgi:acetyl-CoA acetyltransferase
VCGECHHTELESVDASGRAVVIGFTINVQQWLPDLAPPYVIAIVALDDDPRVRLVTNIVDAEPETVHVGLRVSVQFEQHDDVWLPVFAPVSEPGPERAADAADPPLPDVTVRPMVVADKFEDRVAITGIGMSAIGRRLMRPALTLAVDACLAAIEDAGLGVADIDGLATWPGAVGGATGISEGGIAPVENTLGIRPTWHHAGMETPGHSGAVVAAMLAVASGLCRHVLCYRTVWESTATELMRSGRLASPPGGRVQGDFQWRVPFGAASAANWIAMYASQYFHRFGGGRETLGWIALNARANAARNPAAIYRDPMTMDDYLDARMISTPFGLYDCDAPCDGAIALIVSSIDASADAPHPAVRVEAVGTQITERVSWDQGTVTHEPMVFGPAAHLWSRTELKPADVDVAEVYDGFSFNCVSWLEALGFCAVGEAPAFLDGGARIALDGELPLNTHGGQLSAGRTQGFGFLHEAVVQLRGDGGARQVDGAEVAVVTTGGGLPGGALLLTRGR